MALRPVIMSLFLTLLPSGQSLTNPDKFVKKVLEKHPKTLKAIKTAGEAAEAFGPELMMISQAYAPFIQEKRCECLDWKKVYTKYGVECAAGGELAPVIKLTGSLGLAQAVANETVCEKFFKQLPNNFCVNTDWGHNPEQWCYVSSKCKGSRRMEHMKNGAVPKAVPSIHVKTCGKADKKLSDFSFEDLYSLSSPKHADLDIGLLSQFAWKHWENETWREVEAELMNDAGPSRGDLKEMLKSDVPVLFSNKDLSKPLPFHIVKGSEIYELHQAPGIVLSKMKDMNRGSVNEMVCVRGCGKAARAGTATLAA